MKGLASKLVLLIALAVVLTVGAAGAWRVLQGRPITYYTDGGSIRRDVDSAPVRDVLWTPPRALTAISSMTEEHEAHVSADGTTLLLVRGTAGRDTDLFFATRSGRGWSEPAPLPGLNSEADELGPALNAAGDTLFFASNRAGGHGGYDLWRAERGPDGWTRPVNLGPLVNSADDEYGPALGPRGEALYFSSNRPRPSADGGPDARRDYDLFVAPLTEPGAATALDRLNSPFDEGAPALTPSGDFIYFASNRPAGHGGFDLYRARRHADGFGAVHNLDPPVNSAADELDPTVLLDGFGVIYSANRGDATDDFDLYYTTSREVFREREARPPDWAAVLAWLLSILPWLLLVLLLLFLLPLLARGVGVGLRHIRPLGVLARCVIASIVLHAVVMLLLMIWAVAADGPFVMPGGTRVSLVSSAVGTGITAQVTGGPLDARDLEAPAPPDPARRASEIARDEGPPARPLPPEAGAAIAARVARPAPARDARAAAAPAPVPTPDVEPESAPISATAPAAPAETAPEPALRAIAAVQPAPQGRRAEAEPATRSEPAGPAALDPATGVPPSTPAPRARVRASSAPGRPASVPVDVAAVPPATVPNDARLRVETVRATEAPAPPLRVRPGRERDDAPAPAAARTPTPAAALARVAPAAATGVADRPGRAPPAPIAARTPALPRPPRAIAAPARRDVAVDPALPAPPAVADGGPGDPVAAPSVTDTPRRTGELASAATVAPRRVAPLDHRPPDGPSSRPPRAEEAAERGSPSPPPPATPDATPDAVTVALAVNAPAPSRDAGRDTGSAPATLPLADAAAGRATSAPTVPDPAALAPMPPDVGPGRKKGVGSRFRGGNDSRPLFSAPATPASGAPNVPPAPLGPAASVRLTAAPAPPGGGAEAAEARRAPAPAPVERASPTTAEAPVRSARLAPVRADALAAPPRPPARATRDAPASRATPPPAARVALTDARAPVIGAPALPDAAARTTVRPEEAATRLPDRTPAANRHRATASRAPTAPAAAIAPRASRRPRTTDAVTIEPRAQTAPVAWRQTAVFRPRAPRPAAPVAAGSLPVPGRRAAPAPEAHSRLAAASTPPRRRAPSVETPDRRPPGRDASARLAVVPLARRATVPRPVTLPRAPGEAPLPVLARSAPDRGATGGLPIIPIDLQLRLDDRPNPYAHRTPDRRRRLVEEMGGSEETERAVALGLDWLARHQAADGHWDSRHFDDDCTGCAGPARLKVDIAVTGLSVLCFLAADHTHRADGPYREVVARGLDWLLAQQRADGSCMQDESMYSHGIATIVLAEAHAMTGDAALAAPTERAAKFIAGARNRGLGGWRYAPGQEGDSSVLGWQVMALVSARRAGIGAPEEAMTVAREWLPLVSDPDQPGLYSYRPRRAPSPGMTAECMFVQQLLGAEDASAHFDASARHLLEHMPVWDEYQSTYYWYYATLALFQHGGEPWATWNEAISTLLLARQAASGPAAGSWDPDDMWAQVGGRVYQTAICTLTLEVYYRYLPLYLTESSDGADAGATHRGTR